jgi:hypothetical protein
MTIAFAQIGRPTVELNVSGTAAVAVSCYILYGPAQYRWAPVAFSLILRQQCCGSGCGRIRNFFENYSICIDLEKDLRYRYLSNRKVTSSWINCSSKNVAYLICVEDPEPDPHWFWLAGSRSALGIRIRVKEGKKTHKNRKIFRNSC